MFTLHTDTIIQGSIRHIEWFYRKLKLLLEGQAAKVLL